MSGWAVRVLLIEDEKEIAEFYKDALLEEREFAFQVKHAETLEKGLELLEKERIDVVLSDLTLSDSRGIETFFRIHERHCRIPVVLLTGLSDGVIALEAVRRGAQDYLIKGEVDGKVLSRVLRYAIERQRIQEELRRQAQIIGQIHGAVICADLEGNITDWNGGAEKLFGYARAEVLGRHLSGLYPDHQRETVTNFVIPELKEEGAKAFEVVMNRKSGEPFYAHLSLSLLKDEKGHPTGMAGYAVDISDRKRAEKSKDDFVGIVSHELRGPLSVIRESVSQVLDGLYGPVSERQAKTLRMNLGSIDRLGRIVDDLLDVAKLEAGKMNLRKGKTDLVSLVDDLAEHFSPQLERKGIEMKISASDPAVEIVADRDKLIQVFSNLIGNAIKFSDGRTISVSIRDGEGEVICSVSDTGRGIDKAELERVFEKFRRIPNETERREKGTGLGLAICKGIVDAHGGRIWAESRLNEGTKFIFSLPKTSADLPVTRGMREETERIR